MSHLSLHGVHVFAAFAYACLGCLIDIYVGEKGFSPRIGLQYYAWPSDFLRRRFGHFNIFNRIRILLQCPCFLIAILSVCVLLGSHSFSIHFIQEVLVLLLLINLTRITESWLVLHHTLQKRVHRTTLRVRVAFGDRTGSWPFIVPWQMMVLPARSWWMPPAWQSRALPVKWWGFMKSCTAVLIPWRRRAARFTHGQPHRKKWPLSHLILLAWILETSSAVLKPDRRLTQSQFSVFQLHQRQLAGFVMCVVAKLLVSLVNFRIITASYIVKQFCPQSHTDF